MPHAVINNARLWYDVMGEGEPLLLHHGYTASRVNWMPVAERLKDEFRIIMMECRGTGESEDTADGYNIPQYASDALGLMDELGIEKFSYAGHSMGGGIGWWLGVHHAPRLEKLILMAPVRSTGVDMGTGNSRLQARLDARNRGDREALLAPMRAMRFRPDVETDEWFEDRVDHLLRVSDGHLMGGMETMRDLDLQDKLPTMDVPTLMLSGAVDMLLRANLEDFMLLPNASLHVFSRAGHEVAIHEPDGVAEAMRAFMRHGPVKLQLP
ncbi:MAG: alpha/beta fold hydrolase [Pseudomonadales bacterium]|nr:alpha/beta fold hydrolase [Pseudomonadales bacterium]